MRRLRFVAVTSAMLVLVAACGGDNGGSGDSATTAATTAAGGSASSAPATTGAAADHDPNGTYRFATFYEPTRLDPHRASNPGDVNALFLTYDRLLHLAPDNTVIPGLAEAWEPSTDGLALTFHLRKDVVFQDGTPFDADAVKANIERAKTVEGSVVASGLKSVTAVEVVDPLTVKFVLSQPDAALPAYLTDRHGAMISPAAFANPDLDTKPVGAGMFKLTDYRSGDRLVFERWDGYWDPDAVKVAKVEYVLIPDEQARLNALRSGDVDTAGIGTQQVEEAESSGLDVVVNTGLQYEQMYWDRSKAPFDDVRVRQAMSFAIDRQAMVDAIGNGLGSVNSQIFPKGYLAFSDELGPDFYGYDPDKAKQLLADAGYPDGFEFEMLLPTPGTSPQMAEALQQMLAAVGIKMTIKQTDAQGVADLYFVKGAAVAMLGLVSGRQDPSILTSQLWTAAGPLNVGKASSPEVEKLNAEALAETDPVKREAKLKELVTLGTEDAFSLVFFNSAQVWGNSDHVVVGPQPMVNFKLEFRGVEVK